MFLICILLWIKASPKWVNVNAWFSVCNHTSPFYPDEGDGFNPLKIEVFLQTLLHLAAKSLVIPSVPWPSEYLLPNPTQTCQRLAPCSLSFCSQTLPVIAKSTDHWERIKACKMLRCRFSGKQQWMRFFSLSGSMRFWRPLQTAMRGNCISSGFCMSSGGTILRWDHSDVIFYMLYCLIACQPWHLWELMLSMYSFRWSPCWWTSWYGPRLWTVQLWPTGYFLPKWLMISPGKPAEHTLTHVHLRSLQL